MTTIFTDYALCLDLISLEVTPGRVTLMSTATACLELKKSKSKTRGLTRTQRTKSTTTAKMVRERSWTESEGLQENATM